MSMSGSMHFCHVECRVSGCSAPALTHAESCWAHLENRAAYLQQLNPHRLSDAWLVGIDFSQYDLRGANMARARLSHARLVNADLRLADLRGAFLDNACLQGARLDSANLELAVLGGADLTGASFREANLRRSNLVGVQGKCADFTGADLYYARPGNARLPQALFVKADIERAIFRRADLSGCVFTGAIGQANFENALMKDIQR